MIGHVSMVKVYFVVQYKAPASGGTYLNSCFTGLKIEESETVINPLAFVWNKIVAV